jgi:FG-GAP-like repeat
MNPCWSSWRVVLLLLIASVCSAQEYGKIPGQKPKQDSGELLRKNAIERRFLSKSPQPQWFRDKTIAGRQLIEQRSARSQQLRSRVRSTARNKSVLRAGATTIYPGIQLRDALPAGIIPTSVVAGDFNHDGHMDFVVANGYTSDLWIYFGKGDGSFELPEIIPLSQGLSPVYLAAADLRGTGVLDLVVAEFDTATVGVLLGNGDGTFGFEQTYILPQPPAAIVIDDFNRDHKPDIVAVMFTLSSNTQGVDYIATLFGDGSGKFAAPVITRNWGFYGSAWNITSGDVNNDGLPDIVITGPGLDNSQVYINAGDGAFTAGQILGESGPFSAVVDTRLGDLNGDGCLDAAIADLNGDVRILYGDCSGNFTFSHFVQMGDSNSAIRLVDVNGDGHLDLVTSAIAAVDPEYGDLAGNTLSVAMGDGHGNFTLGRDYVGTGQSYSLAIADFNEDGKPDVVTPGIDTDTSTVYINNGSGDFGFPEGGFVGLPGVGVLNAPISPPYFADLNGDGKPDVLLLDEGYNGEYFTAVMLNDGTGRFSGPVVTDTEITILNNWLGDFRVGDFRKTGHLDLVGIGLNGAYSGSSNFILFMPGNGDGTFGPSTVVTPAGAEGEMASGDFNGDGKLDFVAVSSTGSNKLVTTFLGNGDGTFRSGASLSFSDSAEDITRVFAGDFNRDGKLDVLVYDTGNGYWTTSSYVWEFLGNGDGTFQAGRQLFSAFQPMTLADINGDHFPDIVRYDFFWPDGQTENWGLARFTNYLDQANGKFSQSGSYAPYAGVPKELTPYLQLGDPTTTSIMSDLNGDGDPDEIAFQSVSPSNYALYAQVLMGLGDGTFTPTYDYFEFYKDYGYPKYSHDLDGSGTSDLLELDQATSSMHVFKTGPAPALQLVLDGQQVQGNAGCGWIFPNIPAGSGRTVTLSSSVPGVVLPGSVTIPAGSLSQQFCYSLSASYDWHRVFDIRAQLGSDVAVAYASQAYVFGFSESLAPNSQQVFYPSQSTTPITLTLTSSQGYGSTVHLSCQSLPPESSCQFGSSTLVLPPSGVASTTLVINTTPAAQYGGTILIIADDGNVAKQQPFTYVVQPLMVDGPSDVRVTPSGSSVNGVLIWGIPPYATSCSGLPAGVTCAFSGQQLPWPSTTDLAMTITVPAGIAPGTYPFTLTVTSGPITNNVSAALDVIDFAFQGSPTVDWAPPGGAINTAVYVQSLNQFNLDVIFTCTLSAGGTCTGGSAGVPSGGVIPVYFAVFVPLGTAPGSSTLTVTGTVGSLTHTVQFPFSVADYSGSLSGDSLTLQRGGSGSLSATVNVTDGFAGTVSLSCNGSSQITCKFSPKTLQPTPSTSATATVTFVAGYSASVQPPGWYSRINLALALLLPIGLMVGCVRRSQRFAAEGAILAALVLVGCLACGGGNSGGGGGGGGGGGSNTYTITVSASAAGTNSTRTLGTVTVKVTH